MAGQSGDAQRLRAFACMAVERWVGDPRCLLQAAEREAAERGVRTVLDSSAAAELRAQMSLAVA
jgi:hypothetical protein